ncbi:MAG: PAS domain-containing protein [Alphaproteobacteria bacterium]|nr:MAG: PAS domain-containing protein [Alphaproteobacteria bacterium]
MTRARMRQVSIGGTPALVDFRAEDLPHQKARRLFRLWQDKRGHRSMPLRSDIGIHDLRFCLTEIALVEVRESEPRFLVRVFGGDAADLSGRDVTGRPMDFPEARRRGEWMTRHARPFFVTDQKVTWSDRHHRHYDVLALPLSRDGRTVSHILYWFHFHIGAIDMSTAGLSQGGG